jgi:hypothetical protein
MIVARADNRTWWLSPPGLLLFAGVISGMLAWWLIALPVAMVANVAHHATHFPVVFAHMLGGTLMLFVGAANIYVGSTRKFWRHHKWLGYLYLVGGSLGATTALVLALASPHRKGATEFAITLTSTGEVGYALAALASAWLIAAAMGYRAARNRRVDSHKAWMIRSYVLTWAFVLCRLNGKLPLGEFGNSAAIIWLSWVVPYLICEMALQWQAGAKLGARA